MTDRPGPRIRSDPPASGPSAAADARPDPAPATGSSDAARLRLAIGRLSRQLRQHEPGNLSASQLSLLATTGARGPMRLSDLAAHERVALPTASRLVAALQGDGLVVRTGDPADGRSSLVALTPAGRDRLAEFQERSTALLALRVERLSPEDRAVLGQALPILEDLVTMTSPDDLAGKRARPTGSSAGLEVR